MSVYVGNNMGEINHSEVLRTLAGNDGVYLHIDRGFLCA